MPKKEFIPLEELPESVTKGSDLTPEEELLLKELEVQGKPTPEQEAAFESTFAARTRAAKEDVISEAKRRRAAKEMPSVMPDSTVNKHVLLGEIEQRGRVAGRYTKQQKGPEERLFPASKPISIYQEEVGVHFHRGRGKKMVSHESHGKHGRKPLLPKGTPIPHKEPEVER